MITNWDDLEKEMLKEMEGMPEEAIINMAKMFNVPITSSADVSDGSEDNVSKEK